MITARYYELHFCADAGALVQFTFCVSVRRLRYLQYGKQISSNSVPLGERWCNSFSTVSRLCKNLVPLRTRQPKGRSMISAGALCN